MPTYEYVCKSCGHLFEIVQSMRDDPLTECPECGGELRKVFTPPAIAFKGSGFYATDHGKRARPPGEKEGAVASSDGGSKRGDRGADGAGSGAGSKEGASGSAAGGAKGSGTKGSGTKGPGTKEPGTKGSAGGS